MPFGYKQNDDAIEEHNRSVFLVLLTPRFTLVQATGLNLLDRASISFVESPLCVVHGSIPMNMRVRSFSNHDEHDEFLETNAAFASRLS
jgi:hypothetical protein